MVGFPNKFNNEYFDPNFLAAGARVGKESGPDSAEQGLPVELSTEGADVNEDAGSSIS
jgi:hypothetical protein